ncbi:MAG: PKD domain-containing protein, partial [Bacteroidota bacterium]
MLLAIFIVGSIFYAPHASGQAATMTTNITTVCAGSASPIIKFTYTGTGNEGSAPYTFTYKINEGTDVTVTTVTGDTVSIFVPTNNAGSYKYSLVSVTGSSATGLVTSSEITFTINSAPTVPVVTGTTTLCVGGTSRLSSVTSGGSWSSSDETIATVESDGDVIAQSAGQVAIYYTVTDANGCSSTKITTVTVYPIPTIEQITGTADVCVGNTTTFTTATTGGTWTSSTTSVATINSSGVITGVSAGTATITYNYTNSQTSCSASATKIVTVLAVPTVADIAGTFTVCKDVTTTLTNSTAGGVWSSNLTNIATVDPSTGVVTGVSAGTATISYTVTGVNGCAKSATQAVVVSAPTVNPISVTATTLCVGGTITATSTTSSGTWTTTNAGIATINSSGVVTGVAAGTASIVYTVSSGGCSNSATIGITVLTQPAPTFSFTDNPCSGSSVGFTSSVTGAGTYSYTWDFGDGTSSTQQNPSHIFTSLGCGTATFNVTLTVTDANGCSNSVVNTITVKQQADIDFRDTRNPTRQFNNCGLPVSSSSYIITLDKKTSSAICVSSYSVDWGDGSTPEIVSLPFSHTYTRAGTFSLIVTATATNGCTSSKTITVKNIGNPSGGIVNPGNTSNLCAPTSDVQLAISNWGANSPGTLYRVDYGDGSIVTYTQEQMIQSPQYNLSSPVSSSNFPIPHSYNISSCPSGSLTVSLTIYNSCGSTTGTTTIGPILAPPISNFTVASKSCVGAQLTFTNTSTSGQNFDNGSCNSLTTYTWNFGDNSSEIFLEDLSSPQNVTHTFTAAGTYSVTLTSYSFCGVSTKVQTICVEPTVLTPAFTLDTQEGCGPLTVNATNGTGASNSCPSPPTNLWEVTYASGFCGSGNGSWSFSGGTSSSSENPVFNFVTPGTYTIKLTVTNSCGSASITKTVKVKQPPTVSLATIDNFCNSSSLTPSATVASCAPNTSTLTYAWTFAGASPSSSSGATPSGLTYATPGTYSISLSVSNECGTSSATSNTFTVLPNGQVNQPDNQVVCNGAATNAVSFSTTNVGGTTTYAWSNNTTSIGLGASGTGKINSFFGVNTGSSPVIGTITVTPTYTSGSVSCVGSAKQFTIQVNNVAAGSIGSNQTICYNGD